MIGETGERKSAVATPDGKSRKKKKKKLLSPISYKVHIYWLHRSQTETDNETKIHYIPDQLCGGDSLITRIHIVGRS